MKQKLRLWDSYAFLATNHTRDRYKRKPVDSHLSSYIYPRGIHQLSSIYTVYKNWITTVCLLNNYWTNTVESLVNTCCGYVERACVWTHAKAPARSGLGLAFGMNVLLILFCGNHLQAQDDSRGKEARRDSILKARVEQSAARLSIPEGGVVIGDSLPEAFWNLELRVVNHPWGSSTMKMESFKSQLLVLDFWNTACSACIMSLDKWDELQKVFPREVAVVAVHLYGDNPSALPFAQRKSWQFPIALGNRADTTINRLFYAHKSFGQVWIKDGKLIAIPKNKDVDRALIAKAITNRPLGIQMNDLLTYFDKRYQETEAAEEN